jgi:hypothetical protein
MADQLATAAARAQGATARGLHRRRGRPKLGFFEE